MKKCMLIALITVFALVSFGVLCFADSLRGVANTSKKGSLLIFPLIKVGLGEQDSNDTIITISNDYPARVNLKCRYQTPESCYCDTFSFALTGNQPISFRAETGEGLDGKEILPKNIKVDRFPTAGGQYAGELRCWAVGASGQPISYNWLSGTATVVEGDNQTWEYSAWRFPGWLWCKSESNRWRWERHSPPDRFAHNLRCLPGKPDFQLCRTSRKPCIHNTLWSSQC